jgi:hypothetical protein
MILKSTLATVLFAAALMGCSKRDAIPTPPLVPANTRVAAAAPAAAAPASSPASDPSLPDAAGALASPASSASAP